MEIGTSIIFPPFIEEFAKAYPLFYRHGETRRSIFTLGFLTGLGFGITEFLFYVFGQGAPVFVRLPSIFFHAASASIIAYGIATKRPMRYYVIAVFLHLCQQYIRLFRAFISGRWSCKPDYNILPLMVFIQENV
jgi:RsiW-degrading membrane proteinase PrsW (M82 family)